MNDELALQHIVSQGIPDKRLEKIIQKILTDGEQSLSASDFEYYCVCLPEILKMIKAV